MMPGSARVGIVVVSHSARIAEGVVELAREMAGPDAPIAAAGGLAADETALGTDVERIQRAIEAVYSDAGVLVLMDLGSALITAEMAAEACPPAWRSQIHLGAAPLVEGAVAAAVQSRLGSPLSEVVAAASASLAPKVSQLEQQPREMTDAPSTVVPQPPTPKPQSSVTFVIRNPHGLHARPAARLIETAARFQAEIQVRNLTTGQGPSSARSLVGLATLGVLPGHTVEFSASGPDAADALKAVQELAETGFGELTGERPHPDPLPEGEGKLRPPSLPAPLERGQGGETALRGLPAAPGVALGNAWPYRRAQVASSEATGEPSREWECLQGALEQAREQLTTLSEDLRRGGRAAESEIIAPQLTLLADEAILGVAREAILNGRQSTSTAWRKAIADAASRFEALPDAYARARAADLRDVGARVLALLGNGDVDSPPTEPVVLIADELGPAEVATLDRAVVRAIALARGAPTAHAAILARGLGIPAVVGLGPAILMVPVGAPLLVDGAQGVVWPNPDASLLQRYAAELGNTIGSGSSPSPGGEGEGEGELGSEGEARGQATARPHPPPLPQERGSTERQPNESVVPSNLRPSSQTRDGVSIPVLANMGSLAEAKTAFAVGAAGIGLLRTEFLFLGRDTPPTEDEQVVAYSAIAAALGGRPVTIRTLDAGGDKPLPYLGRAREDNPFLGRRSIRLSLAHRDLFAAQLRAIVRVAATAPVRIMFPLIATLDEWRAARALLGACVRELRERGVSVPVALDVGIMVEVPAAALAAEQFAAEVDFFSIGTNDLAQYTMAADRGDASLASLADSLQPAVLRLIQMTASAARARGKLVSVCGEIAADPLAAPLLVGLGCDTLSVAPQMVPAVRAAVSAVDAVRARELASAALGLATAAEVRALVVNLR